MRLPVSRIKAENFRSLDEVDVSLGPFSVLVGPNGSGKSNLLRVLSFIRDTARFDIDNTLRLAGGYDHIHRQARGAGAVVLQVEGQVTTHASEGAPDSYRLRLNRATTGVTRTEELNFKRMAGPGRRILVQDTRVRIGATSQMRLATSRTSGLGTLAKVSADEFGPGPREFVDFLTSIRYLDPDVNAAREPSRLLASPLADDASNLAGALYALSHDDPDSFGLLQRDLARCLPGLERVDLTPIGGSALSIVVQLRESGVSAPIDLADASFGTVRLLALLTALHDPAPPKLTIIEEVDHCLHPHALDVLVDRMRAASRHTQLLVASHSPTLVNRLTPAEVIICDRDPQTGASVIPAIDSNEISAALKNTDLRAGELWFSGALGGVPS